MTKNTEYVYILYNKYCPFVYKIGWTSRTPEDRAREMSKETGTPGNWEVGHKWCVEDGYWLEQRIFKKFRYHRISQRNEHFEFKDYSVEQVAKMISEFININGISPKEEARKAEEKRRIEQQKREREKELEQQRLWRERQRAEQARLAQQQLEARNAECNRLINEIQQQANKRIKQETPLFASLVERQRIQDKYFKYLNLPFDFNQLQQLKNELNATPSSRISVAKPNFNLPQSTQNNENQGVFFWILLSVGGVIFMLSIALGENAKNTSAQPPVLNKPLAPKEVTIQQNEQQTKILTQIIEPKPPVEQATPKKTYTSPPQDNSASPEYILAEQAHFKKIFTAHPNAIAIVESQTFKDWVNNQSPSSQSYYNQVLNNGSATQVIDMLTQYKLSIHSQKDNSKPITPPSQSIDISPQTVYEKYQKPILPQEPLLKIQPAKNMPEMNEAH